MKILLIQSYARYGEYNSYANPVGISYLASVLEKAGHKVKILDYTKSVVKLNSFSQVTKEYLSKFSPDMVGISTMTPTYNAFREIASTVKEYNPEIPVVGGGSHPTALPDDVLSDKNVDFVIRGEGEVSIVNLVRALEEGDDPKGVNGLSYRADNKIKHNPDQLPIKDLDGLPFPARHLLNLDDYSSNGLITTRGCPYQCVYCFKLENAYYRARSPESVADEIEEIVKRYDKHYLTFYDDHFTLNKKRVMETCDLIIERGLDIKFRCNSRVDCISKDMLEKLKAAGCVSINYGVESGDPWMLKRIKKQITVEQVRTAFDLTNEVGISTVANFMLGFPWETKESINNTINLAEELFKKSTKMAYMDKCPVPENVFFNIVTPLPGTELWNIAKEKGMLQNIDYDKLFITVPLYSRLNDYDGKPIFESEELSRNDIINYSRIAYERTILSRYPKRRILYGVIRTLNQFGFNRPMEYAINLYKGIKRIAKT